MYSTGLSGGLWRARQRISRQHGYCQWGAPIIFGIFLCAGWVKADERLAWVPFDLTVGGAVLTGCICLRRAMKDGIHIRFQTVWLATFFGALLLAGINTEWTSYAVEKVQRLFTLTLLAAVGPVMLVRNREELGRLIKVLAVIGVIMAADAGYSIVMHGSELQRVTATGADTIDTGRGASLSLIFVLYLYLQGRVRTTYALLLLAGLGCVTLASGSRGPIMAAALACIIMCLFCKGRHHARRVLMSCAVIVLGTSLSLPLLPTGSIDRLARSVRGEKSESETDRLAYAAFCFSVIPQHPTGMGYGGFARGAVEPVFDSYRTYPHNLLLEVALEEGWIPAAVLVCILVVALIGGYRLMTNGGEGAIVLPTTVMLLIWALVSGDINSNRLLFSFLCIGLQYERFCGNSVIRGHIRVAGRMGRYRPFDQAMGWTWAGISRERLMPGKSASQNAPEHNV